MCNLVGALGVQVPLPALRIEQHTARSAESEGVSLHPESMMKPVVRPELVRMLYWKAPQHMEMSGGKTMAVPAGALRINHYWGPRLPACKHGGTWGLMCLMPVSYPQLSACNLQ